MAPVPGGGMSGPVGAVIVMGGAGTLGTGICVPGAVIGGGDGGTGSDGCEGNCGVPLIGGVPPGSGDGGA